MLSRWAKWLFGTFPFVQIIKFFPNVLYIKMNYWKSPFTGNLCIDNTYTRIKGNFSLVFIYCGCLFLFDTFTCTSWISLINLNQNFDLNVFSNFATKRQRLLRDLSEQSYRILKLFPIEFHFLTFSPNKTYFKDLRWLIVQI